MHKRTNSSVHGALDEGYHHAGNGDDGFRLSDSGSGGSVRGDGVVFAPLLDMHSVDAGHASGQHERAGECSPHGCTVRVPGLGWGREVESEINVCACAGACPAAP
jgi:hypothetical protein